GESAARLASGGKSDRVGGTSAIDVSSITAKSYSRGASAFRRKLPVRGSVSSSRWIVFASIPVLSDRRLGARPVGAQSATVTPLARRIFSSELTRVVLPTAGPQVMTGPFAAKVVW